MPCLIKYDSRKRQTLALAPFHRWGAGSLKPIRHVRYSFGLEQGSDPSPSDSSAEPRCCLRASDSLCSHGGCTPSRLGRSLTPLPPALSLRPPLMVVHPPPSKPSVSSDQLQRPPGLVTGPTVLRAEGSPEPGADGFAQRLELRPAHGSVCFSYLPQEPNCSSSILKITLNPTFVTGTCKHIKFSEKVR